MDLKKIAPLVVVVASEPTDDDAGWEEVGVGELVHRARPEPDPRGCHHRGTAWPMQMSGHAARTQSYERDRQHPPRRVPNAAAFQRRRKRRGVRAKPGYRTLMAAVTAGAARHASAVRASRPWSSITPVDAVIDAGQCGTETTTVIDLSRDELEIVRKGAEREAGLLAN